ncbi:MAG: STAS/SEC14 domain-containing protein [Erythrobacter sp.]|uniref:STAS/SEC14 domain-containing protein n=1 Tax=Erythrobacter sp. TaxID=1042 RepID=UPI0026034A7C|nr:STAS/SEC14 domain-containing protein [Erythrobacter sp.]MDJ0978541.1 STAS/SEC14 domain-containing protein [Erythrobacter sp.]
MIDIEQISATAHRIVVIAEFRQDDAQRLAGFAKERNEAGGGGNLLIDLTSLQGFTLSAVTVELGHIPSFLKWVYGLDRIAVVSDEEWIRTAARIESAMLPGVTYAVYDEDEADAARAWVMESAEAPHTGAFRELDLGNPAIAAFELAGRLDAPESERGIAMVEARLKEPECRSLMMVIKSWHGFEADLLFDFGLMRSKMHLINEIDRYAIVGGPDWIGGTAQLFGKLVKPEIRAFDDDEQDEAVEWLKG